MGIAWELMEFGYDSFEDIADPQALVQKESMDKLSLGFCEKLYIVNGLLRRLSQDISQGSGEKLIWQEFLPKEGKRVSLQVHKLYKSKTARKERASNPAVKQNHNFIIV